MPTLPELLLDPVSLAVLAIYATLITWRGAAAGAAAAAPVRCGA